MPRKKRADKMTGDEIARRVFKKPVLKALKKLVRELDAGPKKRKKKAN